VDDVNFIGKPQESKANGVSESTGGEVNPCRMVLGMVTIEKRLVLGI
jgi:hypothetical protein